MYNSFFGFRESPFNLTPDPRYLFLSTYHREALDHLVYGVKERKGFITITGGIGTGKTTLCRALLSHLDASTKTALIFNSFISDMELLQTIIQEFDIRLDKKEASKKDYVDVLNRFLLDNFSRGWNAVLLIDEAQNLSHSVLEQVRMLSNLETEREKLIQIVLVGQSELKDLLAAPSLRQLDERIMVRYHLRPLDPQDVQGYVEHRLVVAGGKGNVQFTNGAFKRIYAYSRGIPRRINAICDRALLIGYTKEKYSISKGIVGRAIREVSGVTREEPLVTDWSWKRLLASTLLLFLLILVAGFAGWTLQEPISRIFSGKQVSPPVKQVAPPAKIVKPIEAPPKAPEPKKEPATLFLDEKESLTGLFGLFSKGPWRKNRDLGELRLRLISLNVYPADTFMFKKPFRVRLFDPNPVPEEGPRYLLIREITEEGAVAIDVDGEERSVPRDFMLNHWSREVSFFYAYEVRHLNLSKGMAVPGVLDLQRRLGEVGYGVQPTGLFDEATSEGVTQFQRDLRLQADGIAGSQTRALLFQMTGEG